MKCRLYLEVVFQAGLTVHEMKENAGKIVLSVSDMREILHVF